MYCNRDLEVFKELPPEGIETKNNGWPKEEYRKLLDLNQLYDKNHYYYYCRKCEGYIKGVMAQEHVDTLRPLSGYRGVQYRCKRCTWHLGFDGVMS